MHSVNKPATVVFNWKPWKHFHENATVWRINLDHSESLVSFDQRLSDQSYSARINAFYFRLPSTFRHIYIYIYIYMSIRNNICISSADDNGRRERGQCIHLESSGFDHAVTCGTGICADSSQHAFTHARTHTHTHTHTHKCYSVITTTSLRSFRSKSSTPYRPMGLQISRG